MTVHEPQQNTTLFNLINLMEYHSEIFKDACRVCLAKDVEVAGLFTTSINAMKVTLSEMFNAIVPMVELNQFDNEFPHSICTNCIANLLVAYEFQLLSLKSDSDLRKVLGLASGDCDAIEEIIDKQGDNVQVLLKDEIVEVGECLVVESATDQPMKEERLDENMFNNKSDESDDDRPCTVEKPEVPDTESTPSGNSKDVGKTANPSVHKCSECGKSFDKLSRLQRHVKVHNTKGKPWACDTCSQRFANFANLLRHQIKHSNEMAINTTIINNKPNTFQCIECQKVFHKQESLASHMKMHKSDQKEYFCEFCPKSFTKMNKLTRHAKIHDEMKSHKCNICDRTFALGGQLIDHMNKHQNLKPHVCPYCGKGFQQSCTLKDHIRIHTRDNPYLCSECGKSFNNGSNLRQHLLRHSGLKPFECTECPSRFSCKGGLKSHMSTHSGIKPYFCDECGASFTKTYSLSKHKRIHSGEKPYKCEMCDMRFNSSDHVKRHKRIHSGEKPYKCKYCDRAFAQSNDLVKHTRSHIGVNTYKCDQCSAAFRLHGELRIHNQQHFLEQKGISTNQSSQERVEHVENGNQQFQSTLSDTTKNLEMQHLATTSQVQIFISEQ